MFIPDAIDKRILRIIQENSRKTIKEMAAELKLSTTPVFERIKRMEKQGIIEKYVAILNYDKLGKNLLTFIHVSIKEHSKAGLESFIDSVIQFPEVLECHHISGDSDLVMKALFSDIKEYNDFLLNRLSLVPNIGKVESRFSLSIRKNTTSIPIL